jgi:GTPase involved in cell partitioning and DNA repair
MNYDLSIWNTAIDKGVLDSEEMFVIGRMKSAVKILQKYTDRLHDFNVTILIPNLDKGKEEFYTKEHILKNKYQWYVDNLSKVEFGMHELNKYCNQLQELLNKRK